MMDWKMLCQHLVATPVRHLNRFNGSFISRKMTCVTCIIKKLSLYVKTISVCRCRAIDRSV